MNESHRTSHTLPAVAVLLMIGVGTLVFMNQAFLSGFAPTEILKAAVAIVSYSAIMVSALILVERARTRWFSNV